MSVSVMIVGVVRASEYLLVVVETVVPGVGDVLSVGGGGGWIIGASTVGLDRATNS
jgi:hypothetical protein